MRKMCKECRGFWEDLFVYTGMFVATVLFLALICSVSYKNGQENSDSGSYRLGYMSAKATAHCFYSSDHEYRLKQESEK